MQKFNLPAFLALIAIPAIIAVLLFAIPAVAQTAAFPDIIQLPTGFQPEGIAVGKGSTFYTGSLADGRVLRGDLRTGVTEVLVPGQAGMFSVGMAYDDRSNALFVAGGPTGLLRVFNADTGALLASYQLAGQGSFINDVVVTRQAAYVTNSFQQEFYKIPLTAGGGLPPASAVKAVTYTGDWEQEAGQFNANGIEASPNGKWLLVVNSYRGMLFRVDPVSGDSNEIVLDGNSLMAGDGLLLRGSMLYVMRNQQNEIVVIDLSRDSKNVTGVIVDRITNDNFVVPTTLALFGNNLYTVNAKFGLANPETLPYEVVKVPLK
jgi:sugar lactone lactonase YvrE